MVSVDLSVVFMLWIPFPHFLQRKARALENKDVRIGLHPRDTCFLVMGEKWWKLPERDR